MSKLFWKVVKLVITLIGFTMILLGTLSITHNIFNYSNNDMRNQKDHTGILLIFFGLLLLILTWFSMNEMLNLILVNDWLWLFMY